MLNLNNVCTVNISRVYVGQNMASLQQVTASNGLYTAPTNIRYIVFLLSVGGRSTTFLSQNHAYLFPEKPSIIVYTPDPVTTQQTLDQTNSITSTVEEQTQLQTDTMMSTTGSDTIVSNVADTGVQQVQSLAIVDLAGTLGEQLKTAMNTTESDTTIVFPGLNLMGFSIQPDEIDVWEFMPSLQQPVRLMVTFVFCAAFVSHIIGMVHQIFDIHDDVMHFEEFRSEAEGAWGYSGHDEEMGF